MASKKKVRDPYKNVKCEVLHVGPAQARLWLDRSVRNRPTSSATVFQLSEDYLNGKYEFNGESIVLDANLGVLDGHHRLLAIIEAEMELPFLVVTGVPDKAFLTFDRGRCRTLGDILFLKGYTKYYNITGSTLRVVHGLLYGEIRKNTRTRSSNMDLAETMEQYPGLYARVCQQRKTYDRNKIRGLSSGVLCAMAYFLIDQNEKPELGTKFMHKLQTGEDMTKGDPELALRKWMERISTYAKEHRGLSTGRVMENCIRAWNYRYDGLQLLKVGSRESYVFPQISGLLLEQKPTAGDLKTRSKKKK